MVLPSDIWDHQNGNYGQRAPCHGSALQIDSEFAKPIKKQSAEEGIEQTADSDIYLVGCKSKASDDCIFGVVAEGEKARDVKVHHEVDCQECGDVNNSTAHD